MKKFLIVLGLIFLIGISTFVSAVISEISPHQSKSLTSGNGICEYYQNEFSASEKDIINVNDATINIEYLGSKNWKVNDYEGKLQNHDFFTYNQNSKLKGVRFDFSFMDQYQPDGNLGLKEQDYFPWDCQGYSQSTGMISEIKIKEGWNLVPTTIPLRDCYYALEGELCKDDVLVSYTYIPSLNKYMTQEELESQRLNPLILSYFSEENELYYMKSSKWIYVKPDAGNKRVIGNFGAYIPYRSQYLNNGEFKLKAGWNFMYVDAFMVYDDNWNENPLSIDEIKGDCEVNKVYLWNYFDQNWMQINGELDDDMVGQGIIIKVTDDCALGYEGTITPPPAIPN